MPSTTAEEQLTEPKQVGRREAQAGVGQPSPMQAAAPFPMCDAERLEEIRAREIEQGSATALLEDLGQQHGVAAVVVPERARLGNERTVENIASWAAVPPEPIAYAHTTDFATELVMRHTPGVLHHGDASVGQRLTTEVDLQELAAPAELQGALDSMRQQIALQRGGFLRCLFVGEPGNGQALAAASLSKTAGVSVFRIDLSAVVSRYIGETEKNLDRIFDLAQSASAILFFDEADALFGKHTDVNDAHHRFANAEAAYLLRKLEAHAGLTIVAVRSRTDIDPAFLRRVRYVLRFHVPLHQPKRSLS